MILRSAPASPFGRKVRIAASLLGLDQAIAVVDADTMSPTDPVRRDNPLGKIPTLVLDDGTTLYDSRVIVEYLDHRAGGGTLVPGDAERRFEALRLQALADGMADAALLVVYEGRWRDPSRHETRWLDHQTAKIERSLAALEAAPPSVPAATSELTVGHVALACALGYLDLRLEGKWRNAHPRLVAWLRAFEDVVPAFAETRVTPA